MDVVSTKAQDAVHMLATHLLPKQIKFKKNLTQEQKNTLVVNHILKNYPPGPVKVTWMLKQIVKDTIAKW